MSWDIVVERYRSNREVDATGPISLGTASFIQSELDKHLAGVKWSDSRNGVFVGDEFSIVITIGEEDPIKHLMLSITGPSDPTAALKKISKTGWTLFDCSADEILNFESE